jgi:hypothetical protein
MGGFNSLPLTARIAIRIGIFGHQLPRTSLVRNHFPGEHHRSERYVPNFFPFQPALNYGYAQPDPKEPWQLPTTDPACIAVREELKKVMKFWLDLGADGFRVDLAASLIRNDPDHNGISALWHYYRAWLDLEYPEAVLISEWSDPAVAIPAGFHIDSLLQFREPYRILLGPESRLACHSPYADFRRPKLAHRRGKLLQYFLAVRRPCRPLVSPILRPALGQARFDATRWSVVLEAAKSGAAGGPEVFARLCKRYWPPLYAFARHRGFSPEDAQDLVQGFFEHLIQSRALAPSTKASACSRRPW